MKKTLTTKMSPPLGSPKFKNIELDIICENSPLTLAADILANSAYYHIKQQLIINPNTKPNSRQAILAHPLSYLIYMAYDEDSEEILNFNDVVFRRNPKNNHTPD